MTFDAFFRQATATEQNPDGNAPYAYQRRLACGERSRTACGEPSGISDSASEMRGMPCTSRLISIPTGLGKTAAVVLAWLETLLRAADAVGSTRPTTSSQP